MVSGCLWRAEESGMSHSDFRREERATLAMPVELRTQFGRQKVSVCDLTSYGCKVVSSLGYLQPGSRITLRPEGFENFLGTVKWVREGETGIEFDKPLHPAVVNHLCQVHPERS